VRWLAALLIVANVANAECVCDTNGEGDCASTVTCDPTTFNGLAHQLQDTEHDLSVALAANKRLEADLLSALKPVEPPVPAWTYAVTGFALGSLFLLVLNASK
jgi:hypothetical protein